MNKIEKETVSIAMRASELVVTANTMSDAVELLSSLNAQNDRIQEEKEKVTKPLNEALKAERGRWKPLEERLQWGIASIRASITEYQTESKRVATLEAEKIASRIGEGKGKLTMETASRKLDAIDTPIARIATDTGTVSFRTVRKWRVIDPKEIPLMYLITNDTAINTAMKADIAISGIEYYEEESVINRRK